MNFLIFILLPLIEFFFLRVFLKHVIGFKLGWNGLTDYDLFVPSITALGFYYFILRIGKSLDLRFSKKYLLLNLGSLSSVLLLSLLPQSALILSLWWLFVFLSLGSSVLVFFPFEFFFKNQNRLVLIPALFISQSIVIQNLFFSNLWDRFGPQASMPVCYSLQKILGKEMLCEVFNVRFLALVYPTTSFFVGKGCGGYDAFVLFTALFSTFYFFQKSKMTGPFTVLTYLLGLFLMYWMNILRMILIFLVAVVSAKLTSRYHATNTAIELAHTHLGWILYLVSSAGYLKILNKIQDLKKVVVGSKTLIRNPLSIP